MAEVDRGAVRLYHVTTNRTPVPCSATATTRELTKLYKPHVAAATVATCLRYQGGGTPKGRRCAESRCPFACLPKTARRCPATILRAGGRIRRPRSTVGVACVRLRELREPIQPVRQHRASHGPFGRRQVTRPVASSSATIKPEGGRRRRCEDARGGSDGDPAHDQQPERQLHGHPEQVKHSHRSRGRQASAKRRPGNGRWSTCRSACT